jgi:hypothetical protein
MSFGKVGKALGEAALRLREGPVQEADIRRMTIGTEDDVLAAVGGGGRNTTNEAERGE